MSNKLLSKKARDLLTEIHGRRGQSGSPYWRERFEKAKRISTEEDCLLRDTFNELVEAGLIQVRWYDNIPAIIRITKQGYDCL